MCYLYLVAYYVVVVVFFCLKLITINNYIDWVHAILCVSSKNETIKEKEEESQPHQIPPPAFNYSIIFCFV